MIALNEVPQPQPVPKRVKISNFFSTSQFYLHLALLFSGYLLGIGIFARTLHATSPEFLSSLVSSLSNPFIGLFTGLLIISIIQRTSLAVILLTVLASTGLLSIQQTIPVLIGINVGITLTHNIISLGRTPRRKEFQRVVAVATVRSFFSISIAAVVFPLEYYFGFLSKCIFFLTQKLPLASKSLGIFSVLNPFTDWLSGILHPYSVVLTFFSLFLIIACFGLFSQQMKNLFVKPIQKEVPANFFGKPVWHLLQTGFKMAIAIQSGMTTISLIIPLIITRKVTLRRAYPFIVGAYLGATVAPLLVAVLLFSTLALQVALGQFLFVACGVLVFFPFPFLRYLPVVLSRRLAYLTLQNRTLGLVYVVLVFFLIPFLLIFFNK